MRPFYLFIVALLATFPVYGQYATIDVTLPAGGCIAEGTYTLEQPVEGEPFTFSAGDITIIIGPSADTPNNFQMILQNLAGAGSFTTLETNSNTNPEGTYTLDGTINSCFAGINLSVVADNLQILALPVSLSSFTGEFTGKAVALNWVTELEDGNEGFEVQRSADGVNWSALNFVPAAVDGFAAGNYTFADEAPLPGVNYYRLKQMDFGGDFEFSSVVTVEAGLAGDDLSVFPNPTTAFINVRMAGAEASNYRIFNEAGAMIMNGMVAPNGQINVAEFPAGLYSVSVINGETVTTRRFVKN